MSVSFGGGGGVAWFPLGWGEPSRSLVPREPQLLPASERHRTRASPTSPPSRTTTTSRTTIRRSSITTSITFVMPTRMCRGRHRGADASHDQLRVGCPGLSRGAGERDSRTALPSRMWRRLPQRELACWEREPVRLPRCRQHASLRNPSGCIARGSACSSGSRLKHVQEVCGENSGPPARC